MSAVAIAMGQLSSHRRHAGKFFPRYPLGPIQLALMSTAAQALTVGYEGAERVFAPGHDVVIGRDLRADVRVAQPLVSRAHLFARFDHDRWLAVDNGSLNGMFVNGRRVPIVDITDGLVIHLGNPDGPAVKFQLGHHEGIVGRPPQTAPIPLPDTATHRMPTAAADEAIRSDRDAPDAAVAQPEYPSATPTGSVDSAAWPSADPHPSRAQPVPQIYRPMPVERSTASDPDHPQRSGDSPNNIATTMLKILLPGKTAGEIPPGAITIGRANDNDIVIPEVLASRHHAALIHTPAGTEIRDNRSINGTFVNGARVDSALLHDGDVVTIGNIDLDFADGTLSRREGGLLETRSGGLEVHGVTWTVDGRKTLLDNISLAARPGTLTAIIGPSGAGKSTFARLVAGYTHPTNGAVTFEGHNVHAEYASLRSRIGMVPQDDVVHAQLTVRQALMYAAELRLPPDTSQADRALVVARVLEELEMTKQLDTRVDTLSGGQRKRASVALELLTGPSLLILDEPTSGLDPALDRQVMTMLRHLADAGRVVLVVTHSLTYLDVCDQVLLLAPGGKTAFCGPPSRIGPSMGTTNWADIFSSVAEDPDGAHDRYLAYAGPPAPAPAVEEPADLGDPSHTSLLRQYSTIARRQLRLIISDRGYFLFLAMLPFIMGFLSMSVPGDMGFGRPNPMGNAPNEPGQILVLLNVGAVFMGTALTVRDLIGERAIFRREQAVGLSTSAYLLAKVSVYVVFALVQSGIVTAIVLLGKGQPGHAVALGIPGLELFVDVAATTVASAMLGLALSALAKSNDQIMPLLVVAVMSQLVFSGGMIPVTDRVGLDQMSWVTPARWGFAASASTVDLINLVPGPLTPKDRHWEHTAAAWWFDMAMLALISVCYASFVRWKIRLQAS